MPYADPQCAAAIESQNRRAKKTYYKNREKNIARSIAWRTRNADKVRAYSKAYNAILRTHVLSKERVLYNNAKNRAKAHGLDFDLTLDDLHVPEFCPVLGIPLVVATGCAKHGSPSVDRIDPKKGYVKGNVVVMSHKANTMKSDATLDDLRALVKFLEAQCRDRMV